MAHRVLLSSRYLGWELNNREVSARDSRWGVKRSRHLDGTLAFSGFGTWRRYNIMYMLDIYIYICNYINRYSIYIYYIYTIYIYISVILMIFIHIYIYTVCILWVLKWSSFTSTSAWSRFAKDLGELTIYHNKAWWHSIPEFHPRGTCILGLCFYWEGNHSNPFIYGAIWCQLNQKLNMCCWMLDINVHC